VLAIGEEPEADNVVFVTGYANGRMRTRRVFGDEVADAIEPIWGGDSQGEVREVGGGGFWVVEGNSFLERWYSKLLALQIKAVDVGLVGL